MLPPDTADTQQEQPQTGNTATGDIPVVTETTSDKESTTTPDATLSEQSVETCVDNSNITTDDTTSKQEENQKSSINTVEDGTSDAMPAIEAPIKSETEQVSTQPQLVQTKTREIVGEDVNFHPLSMSFTIKEESQMIEVGGHHFFEVDLDKQLTMEQHNQSSSVEVASSSNAEEAPEHAKKKHKEQPENNIGHKKDNRSDFLPTPRFVINLNEPPRQRWKHIVTHYIEPLKMLAKLLEECLEGGADGLPSLPDMVSQIYTPTFLEDEIWGIAEMTDYFGLDYDTIFQFNIGYTQFCRGTSVAMEERGEPGVYQFMHMDWEEHFVDIVRQLVVDIDFVHDGNLIFKTTTIIPLVGISNGCRFRGKRSHSESVGYSICMNRRDGNEMFSGLVSWFGTLMSWWNVDFLLRKILQECKTFDQVLKEIRENNTTTPFYLLICSLENGILLSRGRTTEEKPLVLHQRAQKAVVEMEEQARRRFIVQANNDWWDTAVDPSSESFKRKSKVDGFLFKHHPIRHDDVNVPSSFHMVEYAIKCLNGSPVLNRQTVFQQVVNCSDRLFFSRIYVPRQSFPAQQKRK